MYKQESESGQEIWLSARYILAILLGFAREWKGMNLIKHYKRSTNTGFFWTNSELNILRLPQNILEIKSGRSFGTQHHAAHSMHRMTRQKMKSAPVLLYTGSQSINDTLSIVRSKDGTCSHNSIRTCLTSRVNCRWAQSAIHLNG